MCRAMYAARRGAVNETCKFTRTTSAAIGDPYCRQCYQPRQRLHEENRALGGDRAEDARPRSRRPRKNTLIENPTSPAEHAPDQSRREKSVVQTPDSPPAPCRFRQLTRQSERLPPEWLRPEEHLQNEKPRWSRATNRTRMSATRRMRWTSGWGAGYIARAAPHEPAAGEGLDVSSLRPYARRDEFMLRHHRRVFTW